MISLGILTVSDRGYKGERAEDESGKAIREMLSPLGFQVKKYAIVPDEKEIIASRLVQWADELGLDLIVTTGGTGLSPRDVTPEATLSVVDRVAPGFAEIVRVQSYHKNPHAMLSRATAGIRRRSLILNLPGSPRAVREYLELIIPALPHAIETLRGEAKE